MKRFIAIFTILAIAGFVAHLFAQDNDGTATKFFEVQGELMKCGPPEFMLVSDVDLTARTITAFQTKESHDPAPHIIGYHRSFQLSEVEVTNARRKVLDESELKKLKGQLAILSVGKQQLSAAYLGLLREDTIVVTFSPKEK